MNLREQVNAAVLGANFDQLEDLIAKETKVIRYLMGMSYQPEDNIAETAAKAIGLAARHHPKLIKKILRRLVWAMDEQSGTNSYSAPLVLQAIARERPEFLLPIVPDLAVFAIPPGPIPGLVDELGKLGTRSVVVLAAGLTPEHQRAKVLAAVFFGIPQVGIQLPPGHGQMIFGPQFLGPVLNFLDLSLRF